MKQRRYTREFREGACRLVMADGYTVSEVARQLEVDLSTLRFWLRKAGYQSSVPAPIPADTDDPAILKTRIKDLEARLRRSEMEKDILKKATAFFANQNP